MSRWDSTGRRGLNASGPVIEAAALDSAIAAADSLRGFMGTALLSPIARFSANLPADYAEYRGCDVFLTPVLGVFAIQGGETFNLPSFMQLISERALLLNTASDQGYSAIREELVGSEGGLVPLVPAEYLTYEEAAMFGISFDGEPEIVWLGGVLRLHAGVVKYLRVLDAQVEEAREELQRTRMSTHGQEIPFPWQRMAGSLANVLLPGVGFALLGDVLNAITWLLAVPLMAGWCWYLLGHAILLPAVVWVSCGTVAALGTYRHWQQEGYRVVERPMAAVLVAGLLAAAIDRFLLEGQLAVVSNGAWQSLLSRFPAWTASLLSGQPAVQYLLAASAFALASLGLAGKAVYDHWREAHYGTA